MKYLNLILISVFLVLTMFFGKDVLLYILDNSGVTKSSNSAIESISLGGDMKLLIDGEEKGVIRGSQSKFELDGISSGVHKLELSKISDLPFPKFTTTLNFLDGFATTVVYEIGPSESVSQGWTIEPVEKKSDTDPSVLTIIPNIEAASIKMFNEDTNELLKIKEGNQYQTYQLDFKNGYKINVEKDGYLPISFHIFGFNQNSDKVLEKAKKYNYIIKVYLFELPLKLNYL